MEIWKKIDKEGMYEVSNHGNVRSWKNNRWGRLDSPKILRSTTNNKGYLYIYMGRRNYALVSRLVAKAFIPNPDNKPEVNHIDKNPLNNHVSNIEWSTRSENMIHAHKGEDYQLGSNHNRTNFEDTDILDIRNAYNLGCFTQQEIADAYSVSRRTIGSIINKVNWSHV